MGDAFHEAAIAREHPGQVVNDGVLIPVELCSQQLFGKRQPDRVGQALTQRTRGGFNTGGDANLGMPRRAGMKLAEVAKL